MRELRMPAWRATCPIVSGPSLGFIDRPLTSTRVERGDYRAWPRTPGPCERTPPRTGLACCRPDRRERGRRAVRDRGSATAWRAPGAPGRRGLDAVPGRGGVSRLRARAPPQPPRALDALDPRQRVRAMGRRPDRAELLTGRAPQRHHHGAIHRRPRAPAEPLGMTPPPRVPTATDRRP